MEKCIYLLNCTQPDISFTICELAKFMSNYGATHIKAAKHLLHYLQGTCGRGIIYGNKPNPYPIFKSFTDSDWAMFKNRKSTFGFIIECSNGLLRAQNNKLSLLSCLTRLNISLAPIVPNRYYGYAHCSTRSASHKNIPPHYTVITKE
jgi:hypothetical protein